MRPGAVFLTTAGHAWHGLEIALFTCPHESFGITLELVPALADLIGLLTRHRVVGRRRGYPGQQVGKLSDDFLGGRQYVIDPLAAHIGVRREVATLPLAKPFQDAAVAAQFDDLQHAVERIAAACGFHPGLLGPFVNQ